MGELSRHALGLTECHRRTVPVCSKCNCGCCPCWLYGRRHRGNQISVS